MAVEERAQAVLAVRQELGLKPGSGIRPKMAPEDLPNYVREASEPWERLRGEGAKAFAAFQTYVGMGPGRSLVKVALAVGKSRPLMDRWSKQWGWVQRAELFDVHVGKVAEATLRRDGLELAGEAQRTHRVFLRKARSSIEELDRDLTPSEAARLAEVAARGVASVASNSTDGGFEQIVVQVAARRKPAD